MKSICICACMWVFVYVLVFCIKYLTSNKMKKNTEYTNNDSKEKELRIISSKASYCKLLHNARMNNLTYNLNGIFLYETAHQLNVSF